MTGGWGCLWPRKAGSRLQWGPAIWDGSSWEGIQLCSADLSRASLSAVTSTPSPETYPASPAPPREESLSLPFLQTRLEIFETNVLKKRLSQKLGTERWEIQKEHFSELRFWRQLQSPLPTPRPAPPRPASPFRGTLFLSSFLWLHPCLILKTWASLFVSTGHLSRTTAEQWSFLFTH